MSKDYISTDLAPVAIGAYSQAVRAGKTIYLSGQLPLDPVSMKIVDGGFEVQAHQAFVNLGHICKAAGGSFADVVKVNAYLTDLANFATFNEVMTQYFSMPFPARAAIGIASLPKAALVEVEAVMVLE